MTRAPFALALALAACTGAGDKDTKEPMGPDPIDPAQVTGIVYARELPAAEHQLVRIRGPVFHEKLGDGITLEDTAVLCPDLRIPDGTAEAVLVGRLELWDAPVAETSPTGEISQGVDEGSPSRWVLRECRLTE